MVINFLLCTLKYRVYLLSCLVVMKGPVIRIGVNDLHINDPEFYQSITKPASKFLKDPDYYSGVGFPHAILGMIDPIEHRIRKQVLAPAFSASQVQEFASRIEDKVVDMCNTFEEHTIALKPVNIAAAFKAFALDVISELVIGQEFGALHCPGFRHPKLDVMRECIQGAWICRAFPIMSKLSLALPRAVTSPFFLIPMIEVALVSQINPPPQFACARSIKWLIYSLYAVNSLRTGSVSRR